MDMRGICFRVIAVVLAFFLVVPMPLVCTAAGGPAVEIKHKPPGDHYLPGFRVELNATFGGEGGFLTTRCYFKAKNDEVFTFVTMQQKQGDDYQAVLPAPWVNSEYIEYLFLTVGIDKVVSRSQLFRIDEEEIKEAAEWRESGEVVDIRIDRAQEVIESYEAMRQRIRDSYASRRPAFQNDQDGTLEISTELDSSFSINGFYDRISVFRVPLVDRFGLLADELYTAEQIAQNGGISAVSAATGATSGGMVTAATGISTAGIIGGAVLVAAVVGGGLALAGGSGDSDDSPSGPGGRVDVGSASAADFIGTYDNRDANRSTNTWRAVTTLAANGRGSWTEWLEGRQNSGNLSWTWNQSSRFMSIDYQTGARFSGTVSGDTFNFTLSGQWGNGSPGTILFSRRR